MINCPKCNEPIGEDLKVCPLCRYEFSEKDMADIRKELADKENKLFYYRKEIRENAAKKRTRYVCIMLLSLYLEGRKNVGGFTVDLLSESEYLIAEDTTNA